MAKKKTPPKKAAKKKAAKKKSGANPFGKDHKPRGKVKRDPDDELRDIMDIMDDEDYWDSK